MSPVDAEYKRISKPLLAQASNCETRMSESNIKPLIVLDGTNYTSWKTRTLMKLRNKRLIHCIETPKDIDIEVDGRCLEILLDSIHPSLDYLIEDLTTSFEVWSTLKFCYDKDTLTSSMNLFASVSNVIKGNDESIRDLSHRIKYSYRKIKELKMSKPQ